MFRLKTEFEHLLRRFGNSRKLSKAPPYADLKLNLELLKLREEIVKLREDSRAVAWQRRRDMLICLMLMIGLAGVFIHPYTTGLLAGGLARL
jgi:hypothetical protein